MKQELNIRQGRLRNTKFDSLKVPRSNAKLFEGSIQGEKVQVNSLTVLNCGSVALKGGNKRKNMTTLY